MNPYGPEIQTEFCCLFLGENDLNSEKKKEVFANPLLTAMFPVLLQPILSLILSYLIAKKNLRNYQYKVSLPIEPESGKKTKEQQLKGKIVS